MTAKQPILRITGAHVDVFCQVCGERITSDGRVWIDKAEVARAQPEWEAIKADRFAVHPLGDMADWPAPVPWQAHHSGCDPAPDASAYDISVERIDSAVKLVSWTAQIMGKSWLVCTNWRAVLSDASRVNP